MHTSLRGDCDDNVGCCAPVVCGAGNGVSSSHVPRLNRCKATAPPDPNADPVSGYWHISADRLLWAPASPPGVTQTGIGRYWVRPAGTPLVFIARRLDVPGPPITSQERSGYPTGFYFGGPDIPTEGCWEVTARAGASQVTFVADIRYPVERFARQPATRVAWSREIGRIEDGATRLVVTAMALEDPQSVTRRARGIRIDLTDGVVSDQLWEEDRRWSARAGARTLGHGQLAHDLRPRPHSQRKRCHIWADARRQGSSICISWRAQPAELARLLLQALDALNAQRALARHHVLKRPSASSRRGWPLRPSRSSRAPRAVSGQSLRETQLPSRARPPSACNSRDARRGRTEYASSPREAGALTAASMCRTASFLSPSRSACTASVTVA